MSLIKDEFKSPNSQFAESFLKEVSHLSNDCPSTCPSHVVHNIHQTFQ